FDSNVDTATDATHVAAAATSPCCGGSPLPANTRTASTSISAANPSSTRPIHGTGSLGVCHGPSLERNAGTVIVTSAQMLITYMMTVGMPATNQTHIARRVRHSHTVTPNSVSAASSWLLAPNRFQKSCHTGVF